VKKKQ